MQGGGAQAITVQGPGQTCTTQLAVDKHKGLADAALFHDLFQSVALVVFGHVVEQLGDGGGGLVGSGHFDGDRVLQVAGSQASDFRRERGREQQGGALLGQVAQDALQIGQKANVKHAVGFIKDDIFHLVQHRIFGFDVIQQTTGGGHQHFNPSLEFQGLRLHVHATKHHGRAQLGVFGVHLDLLGHLIGQLACRQQHQGPHRMTRWRGGGVFMLEHALQQWQGKRGGFAGAGLRCTHHVLARQHHGNGLGLDGRHGFVTHFGDGFRQTGGQLQLRE